MDISPRTPIITTEPAREGHGTCRRWTRTINGRPYAFNLVTMPNGERRYFVSRYNGYLSDANGLPTPGATAWGCAWSPAHEWIVAPSIATEDNRMIATNTAEDEVRIFQALCTERDRLSTARARAVELRDVVIARGHPVGSNGADGCNGQRFHYRLGF